MLRAVQTPLLEIALFLVPAVWLGLLVGVSFIATPAKFLAASLSLPVALDVGRATFAVWNNLEWLMLVFLVSATLLARADRFGVLAMGVLFVLLLIQTAVLLPVLNERVAMIIAGSAPKPSTDHLSYIAVDVTKLLVLAALLWRQGGRIAALFAQAR